MLPDRKRTPSMVDDQRRWIEHADVGCLLCLQALVMLCQQDVAEISRTYSTQAYMSFRDISFRDISEISISRYFISRNSISKYFKILQMCSFQDISSIVSWSHHHSCMVSIDVPWSVSLCSNVYNCVHLYMHLHIHVFIVLSLYIYIYMYI